MADVPQPDWRRSSFCSQNSCVEIALMDGWVALRDSKVRQGPVLRFSKAEWTDFLAGACNGEFDPQPRSARS
jgi:hypothetical protein